MIIIKYVIQTASDNVPFENFLNTLDITTSLYVIEIASDCQI